jgi:hypothetical protein
MFTSPANGNFSVAVLPDFLFTLIVAVCRTPERGTTNGIFTFIAELGRMFNYLKRVYTRGD